MCTFTKLLRYRYRTAVYGTQAPLLLVLVRVRDCTVLYCTRTVLYFKQYSPCSYEYRYGTVSALIPNLIVNSAGTVQYRTSSIFE